MGWVHENMTLECANPIAFASRHNHCESRVHPAGCYARAPNVRIAPAVDNMMCSRRQCDAGGCMFQRVAALLADTTCLSTDSLIPYHAMYVLARQRSVHKSAPTGHMSTFHFPKATTSLHVQRNQHIQKYPGLLSTHHESWTRLHQTSAVHLVTSTPGPSTPWPWSKCVNQSNADQQPHHVHGCLLSTAAFSLAKPSSIAAESTLANDTLKYGQGGNTISCAACCWPSC